MQDCKIIINFAVVYSRFSMEHLSKSQIKWVRSLQQKKHRDEENVFVAEGEKCINDLRNSFELVLLATHENATPTEIEQMSSLRSPQGMIGVFKRKLTDSMDFISERKLLVALDGVQDPGNLGTIIRTCDWFGIHHIICSRETADCYNPKVVQATMGALARVNIHYVDNLAETLKLIHQHNYPIYGTLLDGKNIYAVGSIESRDKGVIVMGNEGNGISANVRMQITHSLFIPSYENVCSESLNVGIATAIVLAEFRRNINL